VAALVGLRARNDDLVPFARTDLVVAPRTAVGLLRFVGLDMADVDAVVGFRPAVRAHATVTVSPPPDATGAYTGCERGEHHVDGLLVDRADGVVTLTIDRPERKNAITGEMWRGLVEVFDDVATRRDDRVLVITGSGDAFCSGADLTAAAGGASTGASVASTGAGASVASMRMVGRAALRLHDLPLPTIAAVNGVAAGAGCNLALGCDLIVASDRARFTEIFAKRGLSLDFGGSWLLPRLIGLHRAKELAFLADIIDAAEAERIGLVNRVVAHDELEASVAALARRLLAMPPLQLAVIKRQLNDGLSHTMAEAIEFEDVAQALMFSSRDTAEAMIAFIEKRAPRFTGE
jgi:enoyl-CoA hydratase/carnithine racemase